MESENVITRSFRARIIAAAFHRVREFFGTHKARDEERNDQGGYAHQAFPKASVLEIDAAGGLGFHDPIGILEQRGNEAQGNRDRHGDFGGWEMEHLQRREIPFEGISQIKRFRGGGEDQGQFHHHDEAQKDAARLGERVPINDPSIEIPGERKDVDRAWHENVDDENENDHEPKMAKARENASKTHFGHP